MKLNIKNVKTTFLGIQGSGKTYLLKQVIKQFKSPLVYAVHSYEWTDASDKVSLLIPKDYSLETFNEHAKKIIAGKIDGSLDYDAIVIDEADMFFRNNFHIYEHINNLFINHRHYGLALIFVTRRPQDISTKIYESSEHLFVFAIEGINVKRYLENLHIQMKPLMEKLHKDKHNFIYKRVGEVPVIFNGIAVKKRIKQKEKTE